MQDTNNIPADQASPEMARLIWARDRTYRRAKSTQGVFVAVTAALPIIGALSSAWFPSWKPFLALASLALLLLDVGLVEKLQKERLKRGAKLQEEFDTKLFQLPWNRFVAGDKVSPEDVSDACSAPIPPERKAQIEAWYEVCVGRVPLQFARLICQRTNISYDSRLRRRYGNTLIAITCTVVLLLLVFAVALDSSLSEAIMSLATITPALAWALREHRKQIDTADALQRLQTAFEALWAKALAGAPAQALTDGSRELQDAIYQHRASAPLVFDWIYRRLRPRNEDEAHDAAEEFVKEAELVKGLIAT